jgi:eukaryotic-like serine/threonine-protein kinase
MTKTRSDRLARLHALLDQALDLDGPERERWLEALHQEQPEDAAQLERLLTEESLLDAQGFLSHGIAGPGSNSQSLAGRRLGAWTLEQPIGHGGMGTVWLARRSDGRFEGTAAIKLLNLALLTPTGIERFRREGSALARLSHRNIGRLIDAGVAEDAAGFGQPYLVLELVDGSRIDRYCDDRRLDPTERLVLFQQVLAAVAHAHANLIVHRDLKPSNVLVTADGTVKLVDFGIAKLVGADDGAGERTELTEAAGSPLTPEYAAPEQVAEGTVTTATDIYALGVLLYLLLAGVHPTAQAEMPTAERLRRLLESEPPHLSEAVVMRAGRPAGEADQIAERRRSVPQRLRQTYAGDLDNIVAKALRKEPSQRYATATAFAEDIGRFLRVEPVLARPATLGYRAGKFVRRYRAAVGAGVAVALLLVLATVVAVSQAREARRQRDVATEQRDEAVYEQQRAEASSGFMRSLLQSIAPAGQAFTTQDLLDRGRKLLETDYRGDPRFVARMMVELADHYWELVDRRTVVELLARADTLAELHGETETAAYASCRLAETRGDAMDIEPARASMDRARWLLSRVPAPRLEVRAACLRAEAVMAYLRERRDSAVVLARQALTLLRAAGDSSSDQYQLAIAELQEDLFGVNRTRGALEASQEALAALRRAGRAQTLPFEHELSNEAYFRYQLGEFRQADSVLRLAAGLASTIDHSNPCPVELSLKAGDVQIELGRVDSALAAYRLALAGATRIDDRAWKRWALRGLALAYITTRHWPEARRTIEQLEALQAAMHQRSAGVWRGLLAAAAGDPRLGLRLTSEALTAGGFPDSTRANHNLLRGVDRTAEVALAAGDLAAADSLAGHVLRIARLQGHREDRSAIVGMALVIRARVRLEQHDSAGAREALRRALPSLEYGLGAGHGRTRAAAAALRSLGS